MNKSEGILIKEGTGNQINKLLTNLIIWKMSHKFSGQ